MDTRTRKNGQTKVAFLLRKSVVIVFIFLLFIFQSPLGLFSLLDEESRFPQATDYSFLEKLSRNLAKRGAFQRPKGNQPIFTINHYAGPVSIFNIKL